MNSQYITSYKMQKFKTNASPLHHLSPLGDGVRRGTARGAGDEELGFIYWGRLDYLPHYVMDSTRRLLVLFPNKFPLVPPPPLDEYGKYLNMPK